MQTVGLSESMFLEGIVSGHQADQKAFRVCKQPDCHLMLTMALMCYTRQQLLLHKMTFWMTCSQQGSQFYYLRQFGIASAINNNRLNEYS